MTASRLDVVLAAVRAELVAAGIDGAGGDASLLVAAALGLDRAGLIARPDRLLTSSEIATIDALIARRAAGEPVARILGRREFWSLELAISPAVLDPRPDTEILVETALRALPDRAAPWRIADLGTGSGAILLALLSELPQAQGVGIDRSTAALAIARANAGRLGYGARTRFVEGNWLAGLTEVFDIVVSNPPYIATGEIAALAVEVRDHDPHLALDGGVDGLNAYRAILATLPGRLAPGGILAMEIGATQAQAVDRLCRDAGLKPENPVKDLAGHERVILART